jgi:hypothetical protein
VIPIIITSMAAVVFLLVLLITTIVLFVNRVRKKQKLKRDLVLVIVSGLLFFSLIGFDIYFISNGIIPDAAKAENAADAAAKATGRGLVLTYDAIKKTWDDRSVSKLKGIDITVLKVIESENAADKTYDIEILLDNKNTNAESMPISEMIELNYLYACDKDDVFYKIDRFECESPLLPKGKSKATIFVSLNKDVKLEYLKLADTNIPFK